MVLIADDDADIREVLVDILRGRGYEVVAVPDGQDALDFVQKNRPCLVLLDLMMPGVSGWQVAARMSADDGLRKIPICVVTAGHGEPPRGVRVLRKPLDLREVLSAVREYCSGPMA